jgi:hypothetical protein
MIVDNLKSGGYGIHDSGSNEPKQYGVAYIAPGISLRDYFAGQALAGKLSTKSSAGFDKIDYANMAEFSYRMADAMIAERGKQ